MEEKYDGEEAVRQLSAQYWAPYGKSPKLPFDAKIIEDIYKRDLLKTQFLTKRIMNLEFGQYLENYLWPNYSKKATKAHVMSIISMVNEKFRERVPAWACFESNPEGFNDFFYRVVDLSHDEGTTFHELCVIITFFINAFNSLGNDFVRNYVTRLSSLLMWKHVIPSKRGEIFDRYPHFKKAWKKMTKPPKKPLPEAEELQRAKEEEFFPRHIKKFFSVLDSIKSEGPIEESHLSYCERFLEWMIDLESQLTTRRFFTVVLDSFHVVIRCLMSDLFKRDKEGHLFRQLLDTLKFYCRFEIDELSGEALTNKEMTVMHCEKIDSMQRVVFKHFEELRQLALPNVASVDTRLSLSKHLKNLSKERLHELAAHLNLVPAAEDSNPHEYSTEFLLEIMIYHLERRQSQLERLNEMPLYPTESIIWDENLVPTQYHGGPNNKQAASGGLALPKLNLLFLTMHDYLLKNFNLFRLESTYEIRQDIEDAIFRMKPWLGNDGSCCFNGWARMAHPIESFNIVEVAKPNVGKKHPARVRAEVTVNLKLKADIRREWEGLRKHDIVFLITLRPHNPAGTHFDIKQPFLPQCGLVCVRGCEVEGMLDDEGKLIEEGIDQRPTITGLSRTFKVALDPNQYQLDQENIKNGAEDPYSTFNVILRRKPKENNFKAVLETIRDLVNTRCAVPDWLTDVILGYAKKDAAHYTNMPGTLSTLDWKDTFLDLDHLRSCFPEHRVLLEKFHSGEGGGGENEAKRPRLDADVLEEEKNALPPFKLTFCKSDGEKSEGKEDVILVEPYVHINRGPYPFNQPKRNQVPFTKTQVEAIRAGMQPGLTMVVGPPGTGKTDVAVQIISNIYHNFPKQKTLIITHSNQALNQLFEKIISLDIEERHLLRLGHGEEELDTESDYSRYGRVNFVLAKRLELLEEVKRLQVSVEFPLYQEHTCETAGYFFITIKDKYQEFLGKLGVTGQQRSEKNVEREAGNVAKYFPFGKFFEDAPQPLFKNNSFEEDFEIAEGCFRYISKIFSQLEEFRPFELLRTGRERVRYLLIKEAKIVAMTCTHAALKRRDLIDSSFQYDNILMEEAAQILDIETIIPLLLQDPKQGQHRLKRWIMIGDHHQLPPVIKNMAFQKFCNMEQSLFARFVNIGYPTVDLNAQGRCRPTICKLFSWRYKQLGNLPHLMSHPEYCRANPGFVFDYQLIDVQDFKGVGESEPNPFFYQNLAEAEYICAVYTYLRLVGHPADKISILTTYNGQKFLIRDVIQQRCANNKLLGKPSKITTVDKYQGQQNDIILLSLVRTKNIGHLRDVRRLVVATSRARLGLYVFARVSLFSNCFELKLAFEQLLARPTQLHLVPWESFDTNRPVYVPPSGMPLVIQDMPHMTQFVQEFYAQKAQGFHQEYERQQQLLAQERAEKLAKEEEVRSREIVEEAMDNDNDDDDVVANEPAAVPVQSSESEVEKAADAGEDDKGDQEMEVEGEEEPRQSSPQQPSE